MANVTTLYVKKLFWLATVPYLIGGAILLTSATDLINKDKPAEEITEPAPEVVAVPEVQSGNLLQVYS